MDSILRIQVRVAARDAQLQLQAVASAVRAINRAATAAKTKGGGLAGSLGLASREATALQTRLTGINRSLDAMTRQRTVNLRVRQTGVGVASAGASALTGRAIREAGTASRRAAGDLTLMERAAMRVNGQLEVSKRGMIAFGKDLQWIGRQLNFNFTLPLLAAGSFAMTWALDNERAWTRVVKVYGDGTPVITGELDKVRHAMRLLSDIYGVQQSEVLELAGAWAAAGAEGAELAKSVESTMRLAILGDYENMNAAFEDLIVVQSAYNLTAQETATAIALMNTVENMTAAGMQDLTKAMSLAGSTANVAGVGIEQLLGHIALLVPATGSAATAGNALKTIYSQIMQPTEQMIELLAAMGINFYDTSFQALTGAGRLEKVAEVYGDLTSSQQAYVGSVLAGRRQLNRFVTLVEGLADKQSMFYDVMEALDPKNVDKNWERANQEIQTLLESDPRKIEILVTRMKNLLTDAVIPLIPALIGLLTMLERAFRWFGELSPEIQQTTFMAFGAIAAIGILAQAIGSAQLLVGTFLRPLVWLGLRFQALVPILAAAGKAIGAFFLGPWGIALAAAGVLVYIFRDQIVDALRPAFDFVVKGFNALPQSVQSALQGLINVVAAAIRIVREWLSWLNPFQRHSPSLVDNVKAGVSIIAKEYASLTGFAAGFGRAATNLRAFSRATADARAAATNRERADTRSDIVSVSPNAGAALDALWADLDGLTAMLGRVDAAIDRQEARVTAAERAYDAASAAVDRFDDSLEPLRNRVAAVGAAIDAAKDTISELANTSIVGMGASADAIFENEMAQKRLRLEILRMEEAGVSYEDIQARIGALNGDIEMIRGKMADLRQNGAGSDVLSVYQAELDALEAQKAGLVEQGNVTDELAKQLEELRRQGEILDLERAIEFDPLLRQIEKLAEGTKEMTFDEIVAGIKKQQEELAILEPQYESLNLELEAQELILESLKAKRDALSATYEAEKAALDILEERYSAIEEQIRSIEEAIQAAIDAHATLTEVAAASGGGGGVGGGGGFEDLTGDFDDVGLPEFGDELNLDDLIAEWEEQAKNMFAGFNPFDTLKTKWDEFVSWWDSTVVPNAAAARDRLGAALTTAGDWVSELIGDIDFGGLADKFTGVFDDLVPGDNAMTRYLSDLWGDISGDWDEIKNGLSDGWDEIAEGLDALAGAAGPAWEAIRRIASAFWTVLKPAIGIAGVVLGTLVKIISNTVGPAIEFLAGLIGNAFQFLGGLIGFISALINQDFKGAWDQLLVMLDAVWDAVTSAPKMMFEIMRSIGEELWELMADVGHLIFDGLVAGLNEAVGAVWQWFKALPGTIIGHVKRGLGIESPSKEFAKIGVDILLGLLKGLADKVKDVASWFRGLPGRIIGWVGEVGSTLAGKGRSLISGLSAGVVERVAGVYSWFGDLPGRIRDRIGSTISTLKNKGVDLLTGMWAGISDRFSSIRNWFANLGGTISGSVGSLGGKLVQAGKDLVAGFGEGMKAAWNTVAGWWNSKIGGKGFEVPGWVPLYGGEGIKVPKLPEFHQGGIVNGMAGLDVAAVLRAGEMVLTAQQQARLFDMANGRAQAQPQTVDNHRELHFHGDLSFPNIRTADDAEGLVNNLEMLAGSAA